MGRFVIIFFVLIIFELNVCILSMLDIEVANISQTEPWNLPLLPKIIPSIDIMYLNGNGKRIPRHLWMAFKDVPSPSAMPAYLHRMLERNIALNWTIHLADNDYKKKFMEDNFPETSLLWAYNIIHPMVGNSAADIWRYAVLWAYGGLYMDDDSNFEAVFDDLIGVNDTFIVSTEKNAYKDECYKEDYHLSATWMSQVYNQSVGHMFTGRTIVSWGVLAEPHHIMVYTTLKNIVEVIRLEYIRKSVLNLKPWSAKWMLCMCSTGPAILTASMREAVLQHKSDPINYVLHKRDFMGFGGVFKMPDSYAGPVNSTSVHYMHSMQKMGIPLLASYLPVPPAEEFDKKLISDDGKEIFYVFNRTRQGFENYDAFLKMGFSLRYVQRIPQWQMNLIPKSEILLTGDEINMH